MLPNVARRLTAPLLILAFVLAMPGRSSAGLFHLLRKATAAATHGITTTAHIAATVARPAVALPGRTLLTTGRAFTGRQTPLQAGRDIGKQVVQLPVNVAKTTAIPAAVKYGEWRAKPALVGLKALQAR